MIKLIKNGIVKMPWRADRFFESRTRGFIAAVEVYGDEETPIPVVFQDEVVYLLIDPDSGEPASFDEVAEAIKECFDEGITCEDGYPDAYVELGNMGIDDEDEAKNWGLTDENIADIFARCGDLYPYWEIEETPM